MEISMQVEVHDDLSTLQANERTLMEKAHEAISLAYAPYSKFSVGAAVLLDNGQILLGSNQENAAYPSGLCAERVALFHTGSAHGNKAVVAIAIAAKNQAMDVYCGVTPCGSCRQVMLEQEQRQRTSMAVLLPSPSGGAIKVRSALDLLPLKFDSASLML